MKTEPHFHNAPHFKNFWEKGNGKNLLDWADFEPDIGNFEKYTPLYHQVDDLGDEAVKETYLKMPYPQASALVKQYSSSKISENDHAPESLKKLFFQMQQVPDWFDEDLANAGARFCMRSGTNALIILRDFVLMGGYDYAYLNKPLIFTGALKKGAVKRLKDTLEFWIHVTREDALKVNSEAYQLIVRTRLMHSYARLKIKEKGENWDYGKWGEPINSWDMIATYTGFSLVLMQGLRKLGVNISDKEETGVFHLWKYIGYLLGIPAEFLPENKQQAVEQLYLWSTLQDKGDEDSAQLAKALLAENLESTIYKYPFQRKLLLNLHQSMNWFLLDREINERLKIPKVAMTAVFPKFIIKANQIAQQIFNLDDPKKYRKLVEIGHKDQMKVLEDYIKHTPKDFQY
ncbi:MAG: oxygenase MpaB family protein [Kaistella sp.]